MKILIRVQATKGGVFGNGVKDTDFGNKVSPKSVTSTKIYAKSVCFTLIY